MKPVVEQKGVVTLNSVSYPELENNKWLLSYE